MLSEQRAVEMEVVGPFPTRLKKPCFTANNILWNKESKLVVLPQELYIKKYEYFKIGKTFGFQTTRYLACSNNCLFYYDDEADKEYKGYCQIENVYVQWLYLKNGKYLLYLTNGNEESMFYFNNASFWKDYGSVMGKSLIQLNFKQKYQIIEQIGKGSFSKVYRARNLENKQEFAAKVINKLDKNKTSTKNLVLQQRKILRLINSPYVYKFEEMFEEQESYVFILEYLPGKDLMLLYKQKKINDTQISIFLLRKILEGISDIHRANVIHRDLKPQNIIINLQTLHPSIIDFGLSLHLDQTVTAKNYKRCGTMGYMAPEVIDNTGEGKKNYGCKCDLFSFGIIAHMLLLGFNPLKGDSYDETFLRNKACDIDLNKKNIVQKYGQNCYTFLSKLLSRHPQLRYDSQQALKSDFFKQKDKPCDKDKQQSSSTVQQKRKGFYQSTKSVKQ